MRNRPHLVQITPPSLHQVPLTSLAPLKRPLLCFKLPSVLGTLLMIKQRHRFARPIMPHPTSLASPTNSHPSEKISSIFLLARPNFHDNNTTDKTGNPKSWLADRKFFSTPLSISFVQIYGDKSANLAGRSILGLGLRLGLGFAIDLEQPSSIRELSDLFLSPEPSLYVTTPLQSCTASIVSAVTYQRRFDYMLTPLLSQKEAPKAP